MSRAWVQASGVSTAGAEATRATIRMRYDLIEAKFKIGFLVVQTSRCVDFFLLRLSFPL